jgi:hypothetical protein
MLFKNVATWVAMGGHLTDPKNISVCQEWGKQIIKLIKVFAYMGLMSHIREASKVTINISYFHPAHQHYTVRLKMPKR